MGFKRRINIPYYNLKKNMKISIIIPTYNERENIQLITSKVLNIFDENKIDGCIIVVDDNSPDGTSNIIRELSRKDKRINLILREGRLGLGTAYIAGMKKAISEDSDLIMTMDSDLSHEPKYIPNFLEKIKDNCDVVFGSRYVKEGGTYKWGLHRKIISKGANLLAKLILGLKTNDNTTGYRCYKKEVLQNLDLDKIKSNGYSFLIEIAYLCQKAGFKVGESPILFIDRKYGKTKISKKEIFKTLQTLTRLKLKEIF